MEQSDLPCFSWRLPDQATTEIATTPARFDLRFPEPLNQEYIQKIQEINHAKFIDWGESKDRSRPKPHAAPVEVVLDREDPAKAEERNNVPAANPNAPDDESASLSFSQRQQVETILSQIQERDVAPQPDVTPSPGLPSKRSSMYRVKELRDLCTTHGLSTAGTKHVLLQRLRDGKYII